MELLYVIPEYPPHVGGGIASFYGSLLPAIAARGHKIRAVVGSGLSQSFDSYEDRGVEVTALEPKRVARIGKQLARYVMFPLLRRHLAAAWAAWEQSNGGEGFDAVETTDWGLLFVPWLIANGPPARAQLHGSIGQIARHERQVNAEAALTQLIELNCLRAADQLQAYSALNQGDWEGLLRGSVLHVLPPVSPRVAVNRSKGEDLRGIVVGRIQSWKGPRDLCEAIRSLGAAAPKITWIGRDTRGECRDSLSQELAVAFPDVWGKTIAPVGQLPPTEVHAQMGQASFGIVPSTWDVFNLAAAEMMAAGLPVLCSRGAGVSELISHGENGLVFDSDSAASMAHCIRQFLDLTAQQREHVGMAARETVLARLNPEKIADAHVKLFHDLVKNAGERARVDKLTKEAISPRLGRGDELGFLDQLPLRQLAAYVARRTARKITPRR